MRLFSRTTHIDVPLTFCAWGTVREADIYFKFYENQLGVENRHLSLTWAHCFIQQLWTACGTYAFNYIIFTCSTYPDKFIRDNVFAQFYYVSFSMSFCQCQHPAVWLTLHEICSLWNQVSKTDHMLLWKRVSSRANCICSLTETGS